MITPVLLKQLNPRLKEKDAEVIADKLGRAAEKGGVNTPLRVAHLLGQLGHESGFMPVQENLSYSAKRMTEVWPNRFPTLNSAAPFAFDPRALANKTYGGRMGNTGPEDGWNYRGRGMIQLTGKANYRTYGALTGFDLVGDPDLMLQFGVSAIAAVAYWNAHGCNRLADRNDVSAVTFAINGGQHGLHERALLTEKARRLLA